LGTVVTLIVVVGAYQHFGNPQRPVVAVVGDSITSMSEGSIQRDLTPGYQLEMYAHPGDTMYQLLPVIKRIDSARSGAPGDWIIEAGTNDMAWFEDNGHDDPFWWWFLEQEVISVSSAHCVVVLTISPVLGLTDPNAALLNSDIEALPATHPNFHVLEWGTIEYRNPSWVESDHIHPTPAGRLELARLERGALHADC